jgi:hypothetical protein
MPLTLSGTNGVSGVDGTASTPSLRGSDLTGNGIVYGTDTVQIATGGTTAVTVDSSQNVGIGTTTPSTYGLEVKKASGAAGILVSSGANNGGWFIAGTDAYITNNSNGPTQFWNNGAERARIDASGNLQIGMTDLSSYTLYTKFAVKLGNGQGMGIISAANTDNAYFAFGYGYASDAQQYSAFIARKGQDVLSFGTGNVERARINANGEMITGGTTDNGAYNLQCNGTSVWGAGAYVNGSDERIKDNIQDIASCVDVVMSLRPVTFQYKPEFSKDTNVQPGFIAQDLQQALAGQVYEAGVVMEGPEYLSVAYQSLIPVLTKAIQELSAKNDALEARIAALEAN